MIIVRNVILSFLAGAGVSLLFFFVVPNSSSTTRRELERRARDWNPTTAPTLTDSSMIAVDMDVAGEWLNKRRLDRSALKFTKLSEQQFDVDFDTSGCVGGCRFSRKASARDGVITFDGAVAEYSGRTYNTLYAIRVAGADYLAPADDVQGFEEALKSGSDFWKFYVFLCATR